MNVLFTNGFLANLRESIRRKHSVNGNVVRFMCTGLSVGSQGQQTATTRDPTARYSSARSYHPPPRPKRNPS